jgi:hypothetical protein
MYEGRMDGLKAHRRGTAVQAELTVGVGERERVHGGLSPLEICSVFVDEHLIARRTIVAHLIVAEGGRRKNNMAMRTAETFGVVSLAGGAHALALVHRLWQRK